MLSLTVRWKQSSRLTVNEKPFMMLLIEEKTHFDAHESVIIEPTESCELLVSVAGKQSRVNYDRASSTPLKLTLQ
jgi:hypothetical protein